MTTNGNNLIARMLRVSTITQAQKGYSLEVQNDVLSALIAREGYSTLPELVLEDDGYEGDDWSRPAIRQGLELVQSGKAKGLAFLDTDRFARDLHGGLGYLKEIRKAGGVVLFADIGAYRDDAEFQILLHLKLSVGQYGKAKTKALSRAAVLRKVRNGEVHGGRAPYGYFYERKTKESPARLVLIPEQARIIVMIYEWYIEGASLRAIVRRLVADGVLPPKSHWNSKTVADILAERTYLGTWHYNKRESIEPQTIRSSGPRHRRRSSHRLRPEGEWVGLSVEPIVTPGMFDAAAARIATNRHTIGGRPSRKYKLKGLVWCGLCGTRFCGQPNHGRPRYCCANRDRISGAMNCHARSVMAEALEHTALQAVEDVIANERTLEKLLANHRAELAAGMNTPDIERIKGRLVQVRRRQDKARAEALRAAEAGDTEGEAFYDHEVREATAQRLELQGQLRSKTVVVDFQVDVASIARRVRAALRKATPEQQQELLRGIIRRIIYRDGEAEIEFSIPVSGVSGGQYCECHQSDVHSIEHVHLKILRRVA